MSVVRKVVKKKGERKRRKKKLCNRRERGWGGEWKKERERVRKSV